MKKNDEIFKANLVPDKYPANYFLKINDLQVNTGQIKIDHTKSVKIFDTNLTECV